MISISKIFRFEAAHTIHLYPGQCANIHGHSYELHVTVHSKLSSDTYLEGLGMVMDFKELKSIVHQRVLNELDHKVILSKAYMIETEKKFLDQELVVFNVEPTAENLLCFIRDKIQSGLPEQVKLKSLKLFETRDADAEWFC